MTEDSAAFGMVLHDDHAVARDNRQIVYPLKTRSNSFHPGAIQHFGRWGSCVYKKVDENIVHRIS